AARTVRAASGTSSRPPTARSSERFALAPGRTTRSCRLTGASSTSGAAITTTWAYETASGRVREVGPLAGGVRPFTVNGANALAFTTATGVAGFQVSSIASGHVLYSISFGPMPAGFPYTAPSHGISLSPDERQLYVIDAARKLVRAYDVSGVAHGVAPRELGAIHVAGWNGRESPCAYDCGQDGWLQHSLDGRYVFVGDSGEVIETATRRVI